MICTGFERYLEGYLCDDLSGEDRERFEEHLVQCISCREEVESFQSLSADLRGASEWGLDAPPHLAGRILARLPSRPRPLFWSWRFIHPFVAILSLAVALGLGYMIRDTAVEAPVVPSEYQQVRIIFFSPDALSVALVGDFNEWGQREVTVGRSDGGVWEFTMSLKPGVYHYNLLVDGERWLANPKASTLVPDGFGGYNSVLVVSEKCRDDCA